MRIPEPGDVLADKYRLDEVLGEGGFGVVFRGTTKDTGRPVAVKILKPKSGGYEMSRAARFLREMATIARLQSPHTLTLYDYGKTDDGVLFMVCEYIDGEDLFALMARRGRLEEHEVVWILYQVLQSLAEAHELGVLHRDIKPSNIRIFEYERDPLRVKVLDFGLAKAIEPGQHANLTGTNKAIGTPRYMAPEQLTGQPLSPGTDLYAVGLVAVEMLLGRKSQTFREFKPGRRAFVSAADDVSPALRDVINRLLETDASKRHRSATDVLALLRPLRRRGPLPRSRALPRIEPPPEDTTRRFEPAPRPPRRAPVDADQTQNDDLRLHLVAGFSVMMVLVAFTIVWTLAGGGGVEPQHEARRVDNPFGVVSTELDVGNAKTQDVEARSPSPRSGDNPIMGSSGCGQPPRRGSSIVRSAVLAPYDYDKMKPHPAIVWLMADQDDPMRVPRSAVFRRLIEEEGILVIAPNSPSQGDWRADQLETLRLAVEDAKRRFCIAEDSIYIMSNGGAGHLAAASSCEPWVSGVAISNFSRRGATFKACAPTIWFSAKDSNYIPIDGGKSCTPLPQTKDLRSLGRVEKDMQKLLGCHGPATTSVDDERQCRTWTCETPFESCVVNGGFGWPGTAPPPAVQLANLVRCEEPPPSGFDAARHAWQFFQNTKETDQRATLMDPAALNEQAPDRFVANFSTTEGDFDVEVIRNWAPQGADRFYNLVKAGYYRDIAAFRVIDGFMAQFGIHGDPSVNEVWKDAAIPDDEGRGISNDRGTLTFAAQGPDTRTVQLFINHADNAALDRQGFLPIGRVIGDGMKVVDRWHSGYGEGAPAGMGPSQREFQARGNEILRKEYPKLSYIRSITLTE